ncbi:MAG: caspase family protein [Planctomycetota bacterium]
MHVRTMLLAAIGGWIFMAGCAWNEPLTFDKDPDIVKMREAGIPKHPYRLAVAPVRNIQNPKAEDKDGHYSLPFRQEVLTKRFVETLRKMQIFREVIQVGEKNPGADFNALLTEAWEANADLLLAIDVSRYEVYWVGNNGLFIPNLIWWSFAWALSGYVDDETYGGGMDINASIFSVHSNQKIETWPIRKDIELDLNDFERGWMLLGWLRVPGALDEENWRKVDEVITPHTERKVKVELVKSLGESFKAVTGTAGFTRKMSKRLALVVGIDRWDDYRLNWIRFASDDAKAVEKALTIPEAGIGMPAKNLQVLVNEQATLKHIRSTIKDFLAKRATPEDLVILYYAGYGAATADGKDAYLLAFDTKIDAMDKTALKISSLKKMLAEVKAKNVVIVLDAAFNADEATRSATKNIHSGAAITMDPALFKSLGGSGRVVTLACGLDEGAQLFAPKKHGMFTHFLVDGLVAKAKPADKNKDGKITLFEALSYAKKKTEEETQLADEPQTPAVFGKPKGTVVLSQPRRETATPPKKTPGKTPSEKKPGPEKKPEKPSEK